MALQELTTERLLLKELAIQHANELFELRKNPIVNKYVVRKPEKSIQDTLHFIEQIQQRISDGLSMYWVVLNAIDECLLGTICLWNISPDQKYAELGYEMLPQYHGNGYMSEAIKAVLNYGLDEFGFEEIEAYTHKDNSRSIRILDRHGFRLVADKSDPDVKDNIVFNLLKNG